MPVTSAPSEGTPPRKVVGGINYVRRGSRTAVSTEASGLRQGGEFISSNAKGSGSAKLDLQGFEVELHDARSRVKELAIDREGFQLAQLHTALPESLEVLLEEDEGSIRSIYWPEIVELARSSISTDGRSPKYVFALGTQKFTEDKSRGLLGSYSRQAHADFSDAVFDGAWKMLTKRGVPEADAKRLDIMFVNAWRPFGRPAIDNPLVLLDWTSVDPTDIRGLQRGAQVEKDTIYSAMICHDPKHRWFYLPEMTPEEVWLFKQADSREARHDLSKAAFHTSVRLGGSEERARRSIAVRLILAFEPAPRSSL